MTEMEAGAYTIHNRRTGETIVAAGATADEETIRAIMRDPRYWRVRDPEFVRKVTEGFPPPGGRRRLNGRLLQRDRAVWPALLPGEPGGARGGGWRGVTPAPLPRVAATREHVVGAITLRVHVLEDGRSVVEREGADAFMAAVLAGELSAREVMTAILWVKHGDA